MKMHYRTALWQGEANYNGASTTIL